MEPISNGMVPITVRTFTNYIDAYGQPHTVYTDTSSTMFIRKYKQEVVDDPRFNKVELIGLTKATYGDNQNIIYNNKQYKIIYTIESNRYNQVFMEIV